MPPRAPSLWDRFRGFCFWGSLLFLLQLAAQARATLERLMKTIATFWKTEEAHLLRLRLNESGIPAFIQDEYITQLHPWRAAAIGGVRVQVPESDLEEAQRILSETELEPAGQSLPLVSGASECCACHTLIPPDQTRCPSCGWSYEDEGEWS